MALHASEAPTCWVQLWMKAAHKYRRTQNLWTHKMNHISITEKWAHGYSFYEIYRQAHAQHLTTVPSPYVGTRPPANVVHFKVNTDPL